MPLDASRAPQGVEHTVCPETRLVVCAISRRRVDTWGGGHSIGVQHRGTA